MDYQNLHTIFRMPNTVEAWFEKFGNHDDVA